MSDPSSDSPTPDAPDLSLNLDLASDMMQTTSVTKNLGQEVHVTTKDKVELALRRVLPTYTSTEQLIAIFGVFIAFVVSLVSSSFKQVWVISPDAWSALFAVGSVASFVWFVREFLRWRKRPNIESVVNEVLETSDRVRTIGDSN